MARSTWPDGQSPVGVIEGTAGVDGFDMRMLTEAVGKNDYVEVQHEGRAFVLMVKDAKRVNDVFYARCDVIGAGPKTPFKPKSLVHAASEEGVRRVLGLTTTKSEGVYVGKLKSYPYKVWLPVKNLGRVFIVGKPGSGKSYTVGVIIEELLSKGVPLVVIDAHGEYSSLKIPADEGSREFDVSPRGYSDQIIEFGDLDINPGADIDIRVLELARAEDLVAPGQCTIINLRGIEEEEQLRLVAGLLSRLLNAVIKGSINPFYLILDEGHRFCGKERTAACDEARKFSQEGRKFGAGFIVITQRPQLLDTTVRSLSGTWIIHRLTDPNDVRIALESGGLSKAWEYDLNWLEVGEAVVTGDVVEKVPLMLRIRRRETRHGAPGFNPLDFIAGEVRERLRHKVVSIKSRLLEKSLALQMEPPTLAEGVPQCFIAVKEDEDKTSRRMMELSPWLNVSMTEVELTYSPALICEARAKVERSFPPTSFAADVKSFLPAGEGMVKADWKSSSAYSIDMRELTYKDLLLEPPSPGIFIKPSAMLKDPSQVSIAKKSFSTYASLKMAKSFLYHPELNITSQPDSGPEEFHKLVEEKIGLLKERRLEDLKARYGRKASEIKSEAAAYKGEASSIKSLADSVAGEIRELKRIKSKAEAEGKPTLKISSQIQVRELRLTRLQRRIQEANLRILALERELEALNLKQGEEARRIEDELDRLAKGTVQAHIIQPKPEEIEITLFQVVWVPVFNAYVRASIDEGRSNIIEVSWNAFNGKGSFGDCKACGSPIEALSENWLCSRCLMPACGEHIVLCSICKSTLCPDHYWTCGLCKRSFCLDSLKHPLIKASCEECGTPICQECSVKCAYCDPSKLYCINHVTKCETCGLNYCGEHHLKHLKPCSRCGRDTCLAALVSCPICGKPYCEECSTLCESCGREVCLNDSWSCMACNKKLCMEEARHICSICGRSICDADVATCPSCGREACKPHLVKCQRCGRAVCPNCITTYRRLLLRRMGCRLCTPTP